MSNLIKEFLVINRFYLLMVVCVLGMVVLVGCGGDGVEEGRGVEVTRQPVESPTIGVTEPVGGGAEAGQVTATATTVLVVPEANALTPTPDVLVTLSPTVKATVVPPTVTPTSVPPTPTMVVGDFPLLEEPVNKPAGWIYDEGERRYWVNELGEGVEIPNNWRVSPDGKWGIAFENMVFDPFVETYPGEVYLHNRDSGEAILLPVGNVMQANLMSWWEAEPEWIILNVAHDGSGVSAYYGPVETGVVKVDGSTYHWLHEVEGEGQVGLPAPNPQGRWLAYEDGGEGWLFDVMTETSAPLVWSNFGLDWDDGVEVKMPSWSPNGRYLSWARVDWSGYVVLDLETQTGMVVDELKVAGDEGWRLPPQWAPDSQSFVIQGATDTEFMSVQMSVGGEVLQSWPNMMELRWVGERYLVGRGGGIPWTILEVDGDGREVLTGKPVVFGGDWLLGVPEWYEGEGVLYFDGSMGGWRLMK
ncbi:MAG TPA: hypothetical protein VLL52_21625 [Anaerolineae bacterium]|nr:hypothetical protein [Anaerolineae bacterium]